MSGQMTGPPPSSTSPERPPEFDAVFQAIAAPTRRSILDILSDGEFVTAKDIGEQLNDVSRTALSRHLRVLRDAELVQMDRVGHTWRYHINANPLETIYRDWLGRYVHDADEIAAAAPDGGTDDGLPEVERGDDESAHQVGTDNVLEMPEHAHAPLNVDDRLARLSERIHQVAAATPEPGGRHPGSVERRSATELNSALGRIAAEISARNVNSD